MTVHISIYISEDTLPVFGAAVSFYSDPTLPAVATVETDGRGRSGVDLDPGVYSVQIVKDTNISNIARYLVKPEIPQNFSGIQMIVGDPGATSGPFQPKRFLLSRYEHGNIGKNTRLTQQMNWSI